jgi:hypothetical protein
MNHSYDTSSLASYSESTARDHPSTVTGPANGKGSSRRRHVAWLRRTRTHVTVTVGRDLGPPAAPGRAGRSDSEQLESPGQSTLKRVTSAQGHLDGPSGWR